MSKNIYRFSIGAECLINGEFIDYQVEIRTDEVIYAEKIMEYKTHGPTLHEFLADALFDEFGGVQRIIAQHGTVEIETWRGERLDHVVSVLMQDNKELSENVATAFFDGFEAGWQHITHGEPDSKGAWQEWNEK